MKKKVCFILCCSDNDVVSYSLHPYTMSCSYLEFEMFGCDVQDFFNDVIANLPNSNVYVLGYFYDGAFFDYFHYLGKGKGVAQ